MGMWTLLLSGWLLVALMMAALWLVQRRTGNAAIVDVGWPVGVPLLAGWYLALSGAPSLSAVLATLAAALWGGRLAVYLYATRIHGHRPEEGRYRELRREWGGSFQARLFGFYQLQALLDVVFALPFLLLSHTAVPTAHPLYGSGLALWMVAVLGETLADWQLTRFKADSANTGQVCQVGLWRYSRHPNYFFEWLVWVAFALMATPAGAGLWAWVCPALMLFFLFRVTGIPATEAQALRSKGEAYRAYQRATSAFVPWPRRTPPPAPTA
jgi:steroid 5-alpha reductase family enzyme